MSACFRLILAAAIFSAMIGGGTALAGDAVPQAGPTPTPMPTSDHSSTDHATPAADSAAAAPAPNAQNVTDTLYADNFTDPATGWPNALVFGNYYVGYHEPESYHIEVRAPQDRAIVAVPKQAFDDFIVESKVFVEPNNTNQTGDFRYGLVFRRTGGQYYAFMISPHTNSWRVVKSSPSGVIELAKGTSNTIQGLTTPDVLRVDAKGSTFSFRINDEVVGQVSDGEYGQGEVGFIVETADSTRAHIHYDDIAIRKAPASIPVAGVLYADNFTDPTTGWLNALVFGNYYVGYHEPESYHIEVRAPQDRAIVAVPKQTFDDFTVQSKVFVEPNNTNPSGDFRYGLVFRRTGGQYYAFMISPRTNTWRVVKSSPSGITELAKGTSNTIQGLKSPDVLGVDAKGSTFAFRINDQAVGQVSDSEYGQGEVGFIVETADSSRVHIHYDDIAIRKVEPLTVTCTILVANLNLREGPGTNFPIVGYARGGATVESVGRSPNGNWLKLRVNGAPSVWISSAPIYVACIKPSRDMPVQ